MPRPFSFAAALVAPASSTPAVPPSSKIVGGGNLLPRYSASRLLPQSQSPAQLSAWLGRDHRDYNLVAWCFYGNLIDPKGNVSTVLNIAQFLRKPQPTVLATDLAAYLGSDPYGAAFGYCDQETKGYAVAFTLSPVDQHIEVTAPFSLTVYNPTDGSVTAMSLTAGQMGVAGATYIMSSRVLDTAGNAWEAQVELTDRFGVIQVGYGPASFLPQWLFPAQQQRLKNEFSNDVRAYIEQGGDDLHGQGSYYYSMPMLEVRGFSLKKNGQEYSSGSKGMIWFDYVVQSFNQDNLNAAAHAKWDFFAFQFPDLNAVLMVSIVTTNVGDGGQPPTSVFPVARLYKAGSSAAPNGALEAVFEWKTDQIAYTPSAPWGPNKFPTEGDFSLMSPDGKVTLKAVAVRENQEIDVKVFGQSDPKYEGVFNVTGSIQIPGILIAAAVTGYAWGEVHNAG